MGFLGKIFGKGDPMEAVRRAAEQENWADVMAAAERIDRDAMAANAADELEALLVSAGDGLAELNLTEGTAFLRAGDHARAYEHFALARGYARSDEVSRRVEEEASGMPESPASHPDASPAGPACCASGCPAPGLAGDAETLWDEDEDPQIHLELILATYPPELAVRYEEKGMHFLEAMVASHEGYSEEALEHFENVPPEERDDLFYFERGAHRWHIGDDDGGAEDLEEALRLNPMHVPAMEALVSVEIARGEDGAAEARLQNMLEQEVSVPFCHGGLAVIFSQRGEFDAALDHGLKALEAGSSDPETVVLTATLLEKEGRLTEAEGLLSRLSGPGCRGVNIPLAEFLLRHKRNLDAALAAFKGALAQDSANPRWPFRIAQVYLAKGWAREGIPMMEQVLKDPRLDPKLREEGSALLEASR